ncbi:MAG: hypothetical protein R2797_12285 [Gelidibacter sp.]
MGKRLKITLISLAVVIVLVAIGIIVAQNVVTSKIEHFLSNGLPKNVKLKYDTLDTNILAGNVSLQNPDIISYGKTTDSINLKLKMQSLKIEGFSLWKYFFDNHIDIEKIIFSQPQIEYYHNDAIEAKSYRPSQIENLKQEISVKDSEIMDANFTMQNAETDSLLLKTEKLDFHLSNIKLNKNTVKEKIPLHFETYNLSFSNLFYRVNAYDNLEVKNSNISNENITFNQLKLYTKYSKQKLSRIIPVERDHFDLKIEKLTFGNQEFGFHKDSIFYFKSPKGEFINPVLNIYRDKLVTDDETVKSLYSKMLRNLNFELTLSEIMLKNAAINYSEKVKPESSAGMISFTNLNATIKNLSNTYSTPEKTNLDIDAIFMKSTPIKVNWYFDVNNVNDQFIFKAEIGRLPAQDLNPFSEPNLKVMFEGELLKTYFTIDGNFQNSTVDLRTNYDDFKVAVLDKDGKGKNKFLSAFANLFIKKDTEKAEDNFREGYKKDIERDKTKSIFNFLWLNARSGLLSALTGDGKK